MMASFKNLRETQEFADWAGSYAECKKQPPGLFDEEHVYAQFMARELSELQGLCKQRGFKSCDISKAELEDKLVLYEDTLDDLHGLPDLMSLKETMQASAAAGDDVDAVIKLIDHILEECQEAIDNKKSYVSACIMGDRLFHKIVDVPLQGELPKATWRALCSAVVKGDRCLKRPVKKLFGTATEEHTDPEIFLLLSLRAINRQRRVGEIGGDVLTENLHFGSCTEDRDCRKWSPNSECASLMSGISACRCKPQYCVYPLSTGELVCTKEVDRDHEEIVGEMLADIKAMKMTVGSIARELAALAKSAQHEA